MTKHRSAKTGRFVKPATAARHPKTTVKLSGGKSTGGTRHRSAITGKFVKKSTVDRQPATTITENG